MKNKELKTIFDITDFHDEEQIAHWFKARTDWMPYDSNGFSYMTNYLEYIDGDSSKFRQNTHKSLRINNDNVHFGRKMILKVERMPIIDAGVSFTSKGAALVGNFNVERGRLTIELEFSDNPSVDENIAWYSVPRFIDGQELSMPVWNVFQTNRLFLGETHISSLDFGNGKIVFVKKHQPIKGKCEFVMEIRGTKLITHAPYKQILYRGSRTPMYFVLQAQETGFLQNSSSVIIHRIKFEC